MSVATRVDLDRCTPSQLWAALAPEVRLAAARSLYAHDWGGTPTKREADATLMMALRFREAAVRQLPVERRAQYLAKTANPGDSLASSLLLALHLEERRSMLAAFLDALGIAHENGLIAEDQEPTPPEAAKLAQAAKELRAKFPADDVDLYLAALYVLDRETWKGVRPLFT
ncbi:MAG TPA: hypothetical protein VJ826_11780 [Candidatus Polarisedimenticolaceae bacterium]|nr:hypothetical protein [Candidatus Polarisedimenticolaceae bacterium]